MKAIAYIRVSGASQIDGDGPERQAHATTDFAQRSKIQLDIDPHALDNYPFFDAGVSGTKGWSHRPGLSAALQYCEDHGINTILVENSDRLTRDLTVGFEIIGECVKRGIRMIACDTGIDLAAPCGPTGRMIRQILFATAEFNKNTFVERTRDSRQRIRERTGKCEGRKGYRELHPQAVTRIWQLHDQLGNKPTAIASQLNSEGIPSMSGKPWKPGTIHGIISKGRA